MEILSQDEIDALLRAMSSGADTDEEPYNDSPESDRRIKTYDFRRPDKFSKDQIRTLLIMHETFARLTTNSLAAKLRTLVGIYVSSIDQLSYEEFIRSIPNPSTLSIINMDPLRGSAVLEIDPSIAYTILDRVFGGKGEPIKITRELSDIELSVMEGIIVRILGNLREAWSTIIDLRPRLGNIECNPMFTQIVPSDDRVILITFETRIGDVEGMINLCIPYITIEPVVSKLSVYNLYSLTRGNDKDFEPTETDDIPINCNILLDEMYLRFPDVETLQENDVLIMDGVKRQLKLTYCGRTLK